MQKIITLLAIILPIILIELPLINEIMSTNITGTYDVLIVAFPLSRKQVLELLPDPIKQKEEEKIFKNIPESIINAIVKSKDASPTTSFDSDRDHLIILQLGYQISTGPGPDWVPGFSFSECKLEVPFLRHPSGKTEYPLSYKQTILFSNPVIKMGSSMTGITSKLANFEPSTSPFHYEPEAERIEYAAKGYLNSKSVRKVTLDQTDPSWSFYKEYAQDWWFATGKEEKVQSFDFGFDDPSIRPVAYDVEMNLNLSAFTSSSTPQKESSSSEVKLEGLGWRSRAKFISKSIHIDQLA